MTAPFSSKTVIFKVPEFSGWTAKAVIPLRVTVRAATAKIFFIFISLPDQRLGSPPCFSLELLKHVNPCFQPFDVKLCERIYVYF